VNKAQNRYNSILAVLSVTKIKALLKIPPAEIEEEERIVYS
jgi:hypothetical protein